MGTKQKRAGLLGALAAILSGTPAFALLTAITIPVPTIWYVTTIEVDFSAPGSTVFTEHIPTSVGLHNEIQIIATATLSESLVGQRVPFATTGARTNYRIRIVGVPNPPAANLGHLKACHQAALLASSNPAKFKLVLSYASTTSVDVVNDPNIASLISLGTDATSSGAFTNARCWLTRR